MLQPRTPVSCDFSGELDYTLSLTTPEETLERGPFTSVNDSSRLRLQITSSIQENSIISFVIKVSGELVISKRHTFCELNLFCCIINKSFCADTTDVQRVLLKVDHAQQAFEVTSMFLNGSNAQGCIFIANGTFGSYPMHIFEEQ